MKELSKKEAWMIVEQTMDGIEALKEVRDGGNDELDEIIEDKEDLLDKLSPNWRQADSCNEVKIRKIKIDENELV